MSQEAEGPGERIGPWTRVSSRPIYENPWIAVREDAVVHPDGKPGIYGVVHFKNRAVAVVPLDAEGRVVLVGQHRYPLDSYSWEIPEGGCPEGERPEEAAARELREETGYTAGRWDSLGTLTLSNSSTDETGHLYLARDLRPGEAEPEGSEQLRLKTVPWEVAYRMAMEGEIVDSLSVAALARARHFLDRERGLPVRPASGVPG